MAQLIKHPTLDFGGQELMVPGLDPCADRAEPAWDSLSPSISLFLSHSLSLSLSHSLLLLRVCVCVCTCALSFSK